MSKNLECFARMPLCENVATCAWNIPNLRKNYNTTCGCHCQLYAGLFDALVDGIGRTRWWNVLSWWRRIGLFSPPTNVPDATCVLMRVVAGKRNAKYARIVGNQISASTHISKMHLGYNL